MVNLPLKQMREKQSHLMLKVPLGQLYSLVIFSELGSPYDKSELLLILSLCQQGIYLKKQEVT